MIPDPSSLFRFSRWWWTKASYPLAEALEDKTTTEKELASTRKYLAEIEPGCTYIQSNIAARIAAQDARVALWALVDSEAAT